MSLQLLHRVRHDNVHPYQAASTAPDIHACWMRYSPASQPAEVDWEDWYENAVMLAEADRIAPGLVRLLGRSNRGHFLGDNTPLVPAQPGQPKAFMYGLFLGSDRIDFPTDVNLVGNNADSVRLVQAYATSPTFLAAAGRRFFSCDATPESVNHALNEIHSSGARKAFIKTSFKESAVLIDLPEEAGDRLYSTALHDTGFEWYLVTHEGAKNMLFIQDAFEPTKEYRTIIVGDQVITGAGCIEHFTPFDSRGDAFDARVEPVRNRSNIIEDAETVARYRGFAEQFARDWANENGDQHAYSLDLAVDDRTDRVVAIELNPLMNLGLYATDARRLMDGIISHFGG